MSLSEIPSKIIEKTEALTEKKLEIAAILTALVYCTSQKENVTEEAVLRTYFNVFNGIKQLTPPTLEKIKSSKRSFYIKIIIIALILAGGLGLIYALGWFSIIK